MLALKVGDMVSDFTLKNAAGDWVRLSEEVKKNAFTILAFFPAAFSSVCTSELSMFEEAREEFRSLNAGVIAISVDNTHALREFAARNGLTFPLLSDFHPQGKIAAQLGVLGDDGMANRALLILDQDRRVRYSYVSERGVNPGVDRLIGALEEIGEMREAA